MAQTKQEDYEARHFQKVREIAPECMVLLKSDGSFPLEQPGKIALYGCGARRTLKGGRGSADVYVKSYTTVEQGLANAGFEITTAYWMDAYEEEWKKARVGFRAWLKEKIAVEGMERLMENLSIVMPEPEYEIPMTGEGDTAVYVMSRLCGEGVDRQDVPGDFQMTETEIRDILRLQEQYPKFLLVLNMACIVDLSPVADRVGNILLLSQPGQAVGDAFADVLLGKAYPSGKLTATWAKREDYGFFDFGHRDDTRYREGIYVGYRYFDSVGKEPIFPFGHGLGYTEFSLSPGTPHRNGTQIQLPIQVKNTGKRQGKEVVQLYVTIPEGKLDQPTQVLAAFMKTKELAPGEETEVALAFSMESLASTDISIQARVLEKGQYILRVGNSSRNTEIAGIVELSETVITEKIHSVGGETDFEDWKPCRGEACENAEIPWEKNEEADEVAAEKSEIPEPGRSAMKTEESAAGEDGTEVSCESEAKAGDCTGEVGGGTAGPAKILYLKPFEFREIIHEEPAPDPEALAFVQSLPDEELAYLCTGDYIGEGSQNVIGDAAITVVGAAGETTGRFKAQGIPNVVFADGASGLRISRLYGIDEKGTYPIKEDNPLMEIENPLELLPEPMLKALTAMLPGVQPEERHGEIHEQNCTAVPVEAALAQTWNVELVRECAGLIAEEMDFFGIQVLLAPALNIQRHPLCGRNFEYLSEDPVLGGRIAAAYVKGIQETPGGKRGATLKHFICNNQDTNRFRTSSMVGQRALRDIYARGFEIAVKEAQPECVMSSYNLLNGVHTSERYDLLETLLREEWGYQGMVMSDYQTGEKDAFAGTNRYRRFASAPSVKAGNDLMMPGGKAHYENIVSALQGKDGECTLTRREVEKCAARNVMFAGKHIGHSH